jgi:hypothetical protein
MRPNHNAVEYLRRVAMNSERETGRPNRRTTIHRAVMTITTPANAFRDKAGSKNCK